VDNRSVHHDEHILPSSHLHPDQFAGHEPIGANSLNRAGGIGGTEMSADALTEAMTRRGIRGWAVSACVPGGRRGRGAMTNRELCASRAD
jgi:hypothetical protein